MSAKTPTPATPVPRWRGRVLFRGGTWTDAAYGFGGPDSAEAVGSAAEIGRELTRFLGSLEWESVEAERLRTGHFAVELEVEPLGSGPGTRGGQPGELPAANPVPLWEASAAVGNAGGLYDACYGYGNSRGDEGHLRGTAQELGAELARVLRGLTCGDVEAMKYGTSRFYLQLTIELPKKP